jgi:hypothetical protein
VTLGSDEYQALAWTAEQVGVRPQELARRLLSRSIGHDAGAALDAELAAHRLVLVEDWLGRLSETVAELESAATRRSSVPVADQRPLRRSTSRVRETADEPPRARLHEEIAAVLRETARPLTSAEIADRIRQRGRFEPPRSKRPVDVLMVASRISHESYKHLFTREGGLVRLAGDDERRGRRSPSSNARS